MTRALFSNCAFQPAPKTLNTGLVSQFVEPALLPQRSQAHMQPEVGIFFTNATGIRSSIKVSQIYKNDGKNRTGSF